MAPTQHFRHKQHSLAESESHKKAKKRKKSLKDQLCGVQRLLRQVMLARGLILVQVVKFILLLIYNLTNICTLNN
jgi:hypothetical protein